MGPKPARPSAAFVDLEGNTSAVGRAKPIRPTAIPLPSRHRAFQALMRDQVNFHTWTTVASTGKIAMVTV